MSTFPLLVFLSEREKKFQSCVEYSTHSRIVLHCQNLALSQSCILLLRT